MFLLWCHTYPHHISNSEFGISSLSSSPTLNGISSQVCSCVYSTFTRSLLKTSWSIYVQNFNWREYQPIYTVPSLKVQSIPLSPIVTDSWEQLWPWQWYVHGDVRPLRCLWHLSTVFWTKVHWAQVRLFFVRTQLASSSPLLPKSNLILLSHLFHGFPSGCFSRSLPLKQKSYYLAINSNKISWTLWSV